MLLVRPLLELQLMLLLALLLLLLMVVVPGCFLNIFLENSPVRQQSFPNLEKSIRHPV